MSGSERMKFVPCTSPRQWRGRYARVPGGETVLHVRSTQGTGWTVCIDWQTSEGIAQCVVVPRGGEQPEVCNLVAAVNQVKSARGGRRGGCFSINEWGQVLVPSSEMSQTHCFLVGAVTGPLLFDDPLAGRDILDLTDTSGMGPGDAWNKPTIGLPYHLKAHADQIYFWRESENGGTVETPEQQDLSLIRTLRQLRGYHRPIRFLVNPWGVVLTKVPVSEDRCNEVWQPVYVGRINFQRWFRKEEG